MKLLVTGGAGFIGSNFVKYVLAKYPSYKVINYDKLSYAGNLDNLLDIEISPNYKFIKGDITDGEKVNKVLETHKITHIVNFAAESHVDRSIAGPDAFIHTNIVGTHVLLTAALQNNIKRFHHVSTDEVFGALDLDTEEKFIEETRYDPRSPYSSSKASSDHLVRSYNVTYGLPVSITNTSNNYGPYQHPEKFLPRAITNLIDDKKVPVYGDGKYVRDWLYVEDHCSAIDAILHNRKAKGTYLIGGLVDDVNNLEVTKKLLKIFGKDESFIEYVSDRPGHDRRYSVDWSKAKKELGWKPKYDFDNWLEKTVEWYKQNEWWWRPLKEESEAFYTKQKETKLADDYTKYIKETSIPGLLVLEMPTFKDKRGYFREVGRINALEKVAGIKFDLKQWNHSFSKPSVIRALHAENWNKLIYPITGKMFTAIVDIRPESKTFGKKKTFQFKEGENKALFIPKGLANSICVNGKDPVHYIYLVDAYYDGGDTKAIAWNDPDLKINWPVKKPIISKRDQNNPTLRELFPDKFKK